MKRALITGITGQDGFYLAEYLLGLGYEVHGLVRQTGLEYIKNHLLRDVPGEWQERCQLHAVSLDNFPGIYRLFSSTEFQECYHLAASSFVGERLADGLQTIQNNISSTQYLLTALSEFQPNCRLYFAGSSEMFGRPVSAPQDETTVLMPRNAYGISKVAAYHLVCNYRDSHKLFCCTGILYNHESPRRRPEFVTRKITMAAARIACGDRRKLELGNMDAERDWGYAPDYVRAMHRMLVHSVPDDYVVATGQLHSVKQLCAVAFEHVGLNWEDHVVVNPMFVRQEAATRLVGSPAKMMRELGWKPSKPFAEMIQEMVDADLAMIRK
jgi:GDPmannose 4,6-dehydratase